MRIGHHIRNLTYLFMFFFILLSGCLVYWQVYAAPQVVSNIHNGRTCLTTNAPRRGNIYDRNGILLAKSVPSPSGCGYLRQYTDPSLSNLIGYFVSPLYGSAGIERQFDRYLSGAASANTVDTTVNHLLHRSPVGDDLYLTIDERIQQLANKHFDDRVRIDNHLAFATDRGSVIVTNPHTGEILAMVSRPSYDPNLLVQTLSHNDLSYYNQLVKDPKMPLLNRPIQSRYVPGSTYKTVTLLAGLDTGKTTLQQKFNEKEALGPLIVNGERITGNNIDGYTLHFPVTTEYGFTHSDNIIFAQIGVNTGMDAWLDYNHRFFVDQTIPFDLPVVTSHVLKDGQPLSSNQLADDSFGQGFDDVTPLQMSLFDNAIANNGSLMKPFIVQKITDPAKNELLANKPQQLSKPISEKTAMDARQAMFGVVRCGSGAIVHELFTSQSNIIGKTGTGQVSDKQDIPAQAWMITQAPYSVTTPTQMPALTIVAMKENGGEGGVSVGPLIAGIYNDVFSKGYVPAPPTATPDPQYCCKTGLYQPGCK